MKKEKLPDYMIMKQLLFIFILLLTSCQTVEKHEKNSFFNDKVNRFIEKYYGKIEDKKDFSISVKYISPFQYYSNIGLGEEDNHYFSEYFKKEFDKGGETNSIYQMLSIDKKQFDKLIKNSDYKGDFFEKQIQINIKKVINLKKDFAGNIIKIYRDYDFFIDNNSSLFVVKDLKIKEYIHHPKTVFERLNNWYYLYKDNIYFEHENFDINSIKALIKNILLSIDFYFDNSDIIIMEMDDYYEIKIDYLKFIFNK
ncbi:hypothetical protein JXR93_07560, partial [bacterium]|nr:hypothetical protein [bacterium]